MLTKDRAEREADYDAGEQIRGSYDPTSAKTLIQWEIQGISKKLGKIGVASVQLNGKEVTIHVVQYEGFRALPPERISAGGRKDDTDECRHEPRRLAFAGHFAPDW